jgi:cell division protein FtsZ
MTNLQFDLPKDQSSIIKVVGVGGGGSNAVNHMYEQGIVGVNFVIGNTDAQALETSQVPNKIQLGPKLTQGLGAGSNPECGMQSTEESIEEIKADSFQKHQNGFCDCRYGWWHRYRRCSCGSSCSP